MNKTIGKILLLLILSGTLVACTSGEPRESEPKQPNIVFIFADDQSFNMIHALGNHELITPNLDRLVDEGVTFTHAYNMGAWNGAVCLASRAMLNTGRFVWRAHKAVGDPQGLQSEGSTWAQLMARAGYETYMTGKWHVSVPADSIFQVTNHIRPGMPNQTPEGYNRPLSENDTIWKPWDTKFGGYWKGGKHWSEIVADDAEQFIAQSSQSGQPFFMYLAFNAPHDPRQSPKEYVDMYPLENVAVPQNFLQEYPYKEEMGAGKDLRDERLAPFPRTEYSIKVNRQEYNAITTHMDAQVGRILAALEKSGQLENTYIFFSADHGLAVGSHGLVGKQNMYDHSVRVPLMVVGPGIPENRKVDADVYLQDIMASAIELAGIEKPEYVEFNSLMGLAYGQETESVYPEIYGCYTHTQRMIRDDGFKLIVYPEAKVMRLYDVKNDPLEMNDLAALSENKDTVKRLFRRLVKLQKEMDDELDLVSVFGNMAIDER
ncbi:sulfatase-like hydrolase/transferase [uncultured Sunxiuqinia sp.]|uniref:sulfatase-like hydrolase/transferase n=1 Tax=uncultured Sunxiuqinia sp. TaxID=1573825 RepID=UPI002629F8B6|nr:sulfatase-like hydrolase/transferase [uncultured Sunxiuqinia sp.]